MSEALEAAERSIEPYRETDGLVWAKCYGLMRGYDHRYRNAGWKAEAIEQYVESELWNPATERRSRSFRVAGKIDVIAEHSGRRYIIDHKTTSDDITDPNANYWRQLVVEAQASHYMLLQWLNGQKVDGAVWDVIRKPGISPKKLTKAERASVVSEGRYFGLTVSNADRKMLAEGEERESHVMFAYRLAADTIERSERYFQRRPIPRMDHELLEYATELWDHSQEILSARRTERTPRNSGACMLYGSPCQFLGVCSGHDEIDSDRWRRKQQVHAELPIVDGDGRDILTNSRIRCFQTCRRKHHYQYELGVERVDDEEKESLYFGRIFHLALNAWWSCFLTGENHEYGNTEHSASGVESSADESVESV